MKEDYDELFTRREQRDSRSERKRLQAKDRSRYKKSDQDQRKKLLEAPEGVPELTGRVLSIVGQEVIVDVGTRMLICTLRGTLKQERLRRKNLLTVGDIVHVELCSSEQGVISYVTPRRSQLSRADNLSRQKEQLIAANIDLVLITVSVVTPTLKPPIIDRYLIAARQGAMDAVVVVNKIDLLEGDSFAIEVERELYGEAKDAYALAGVPFLAVSTKSGVGLDSLLDYMRDKTSVFSGQSGVGKSSLINALTGGNAATREAVARTKKGAHTTTCAGLIALPTGGWVIDTPGIRSFGLWQLERSDLVTHFDEIQKYGVGCFFADCTHTHEEDCAVIRAVEEGAVHPLRYSSYCALLAQMDEEHRRR